MPVETALGPRRTGLGSLGVMDPVRRFGELVGDPATPFPLDEAALLIASAFRPGLDLGHQLWLLDDLADTCPESDFQVLVDHLVRVEGFRGNHDDYQDPENSMLDAVLLRRLGIPITLALVVIEVGRRLGVPVVGIGMPGHFLIRSGPDPTRFADPFHGGVILGPADCRVVFQAVTGGATAWNEAYLQPVTERALTIRMLNNLKANYVRTGDRARLRTVMRLRAMFPEVEPVERTEVRRLMAPFN